MVAHEKIAKGFPDGTYRPLTPVNRDAMAAFLFRIFCDGGVFEPTGQTFTDVTPDNQFYKEIEWLASTGISTGWTNMDDTKIFRPTEPINRDAIAAFLYRAVQRFGVPPLYPASPATPTGLTATVDGSQVKLTWDASPEWHVDRYDVWRGSAPDNPEIELSGGAVVQPAFTDSAAPSGTSYYWVIAVSRYGVVSDAATVEATVG